MEADGDSEKPEGQFQESVFLKGETLLKHKLEPYFQFIFIS